MSPWVGAADASFYINFIGGFFSARAPFGSTTAGVLLKLHMCNIFTPSRHCCGWTEGRGGGKTVLRRRIES